MRFLSMRLWYIPEVPILLGSRLSQTGSVRLFLIPHQRQQNKFDLFEVLMAKV